jgi:hypothetical protein
MSFGIWTSANHPPRLQPRTDRITRADNMFFARKPERKHRLRISCPSEIDQCTLMNGEPLRMPPGIRLFTVMRVITDEFRMQLFALFPDHFETDLSEEECARIYAAWANPSDWEAEARILETVRRVSNARN